MLAFSTGASATVHIVTANNFFYAPASITIDDGDTVRFIRNAGSHPTSSTTGDWVTPVSFPLNSGNPMFDLVLPGPGTYSYQCDFHVSLGMVGTIVVNAVGGDCDASTAPTGLTAVPGASGTALSWDAVAGSVACEVQGRPAGTGPFAKLRVIAPEPSATNVPCAFLTAGTNYEWTVRCACNISPLEVTPLAATETFVAACAEPREAGFDPDGEFIVFPNPAADMVSWRLSMLETGSLVVELVDINGRILQSQTNHADRNSVMTSTFDVSDLSAGTYFLRAFTSKGEQIQSFIVE